MIGGVENLVVEFMVSKIFATVNNKPSGSPDFYEVVFLRKSVPKTQRPYGKGFRFHCPSRRIEVDLANPIVPVYFGWIEREGILMPDFADQSEPYSDSHPTEHSERDDSQKSETRSPADLETLSKELRTRRALRDANSPREPVGKTEVFAVFLLVILADVTVYRGHGFAGWAAFVILVPPLLVLGTRKIPRSLMATILGGLLLVVSLKLLWSGTPLLILTGVALLLAFGMETTGLTPFVLDIPVFALHLWHAGFLRWEEYWESLRKSNWVIPRATIFQYGLPVAVVLGFSGLFTMANPDLASRAENWLHQFREFFFNSLLHLTPSFTEILFWGVMAWIFAGLLKPVMAESFLARIVGLRPDKQPDEDQPQNASMYPAYFNTLLAVIGLFIVYLAFEFQTLWLREFPAGFHYSGYAHEGAAWLTAALALATVLLSAIFRGEVLFDSRLPKLRRLAWIWSALNLCLAVAVYHRLLIYVGFNGMTRMRVIGFLGITSVVFGFVLVVRKITTGRDFLWLVRRQMWVVAFAGILYVITPVDALVHRYNVHRILVGDPAPSVQLTVHPIDSSGFLELAPLLASENEIIREGVRAMLAEKALELRQLQQEREQDGWTSFQWADWLLSKRLNESQDVWGIYEQSPLGDEALETFKDYAYQWY